MSAITTVQPMITVQRTNPVGYLRNDSIVAIFGGNYGPKDDSINGQVTYQQAANYLDTNRDGQISTIEIKNSMSLTQDKFNNKAFSFDISGLPQEYSMNATAFLSVIDKNHNGLIDQADFSANSAYANGAGYTSNGRSDLLLLNTESEFAIADMFNNMVIRGTPLGLASTIPTVPTTPTTPTTPVTSNSGLAGLLGQLFGGSFGTTNSLASLGGGYFGGGTPGFNTTPYLGNTPNTNPFGSLINNITNGFNNIYSGLTNSLSNGFGSLFGGLGRAWPQQPTPSYPRVGGFNYTPYATGGSRVYSCFPNNNISSYNTNGFSNTQWGNYSNPWVQAQNVTSSFTGF